MSDFLTRLRAQKGAVYTMVETADIEKIERLIEVAQQQIEWGSIPRVGEVADALVALNEGVGE